MKQTKFRVGDRIVRTGYEWSSSERMTINEIVSDEHPICPQIWYITTNDRGKKMNGLVSIVDGCFHLIDNTEQAGR